MALALDEPRETDSVYDVKGYKWLVDKDFMEHAKPIKVDFTPMGFAVSSSLDLGGGGCGGCGGGDSCSTGAAH